MSRNACLSVIAASAAGLGMGWIYPIQKETKVSSDSRDKPTQSIVNANAISSTASTLPALPSCTTVEECRAVLFGTDKESRKEHPLLQQAVRAYALRRWLELDAESALAEAEHNPGAEFNNEGFAADLFRVWLDLNPESAISAWTQASPLLSRNTRILLFQKLAEQDPARGFALLQTPQGKGPENRDEAETSIFQRWAQQNPQEAVTHAVKENTRNIVMAEWVKQDLAAALTNEQSKHYEKNGGRWAPAVLMALLKSDPAAANKIIQSLGESGTNTKQNTALTWARENPQEALTWAQGQPSDAPFVKEVLISTAQEIATSDPVKTIELLQSLAPNKNNDDSQDFWLYYAYREAFASLAAKDLAAARNLINNDPALAAKGPLGGYLTYAFSKDTSSTIEQCRTWLANPALKEGVIQSTLIAFNWGYGAGARDMSEVVQALPEISNRVTGEELSGWAKANPTGAAEFVAQRAADGHPVNDLAISGVLADIAISQPAWTATWIGQIADQALQAKAATTLAANWAAFDPDAATAWINSLPAGELLQAAQKGYDHRNEKAPNSSKDDMD